MPGSAASRARRLAGFRYGPVAKSADAVARWSAIGLGFSIPIATAIDNVLAATLLLGWLVAGRYRESLQALRANPVAQLTLALYALLLLGALHGVAPVSDRLSALGKYKDLVYVAIFLPLFRDELTKRRALVGFGAAMLLTLALSYAISWGAPVDFAPPESTPDNPMVFKLHITQNVLMAFAALLFATAARYQRGTKLRWCFAVLSLLAIYNVLFMVQGRTGHLVLGVLLVFYFADWLGWKGFAFGLLISSLLAVLAFHDSQAFRDRALKAHAEYQFWQSGGEINDAGGGEDSVGIRMRWYETGTEIVAERPLIGVGTGGFRHAYAAKRSDDAGGVARTPHNEYLALAIQLGLSGALFLLYLFYRQWRLARFLPDVGEQALARGLILTMATGCVFNSLLLDHTEGLLFAWLSALLFARLPDRKAQDAALVSRNA